MARKKVRTGVLVAPVIPKQGRNLTAQALPGKNIIRGKIPIHNPSQRHTRHNTE